MFKEMEKLSESTAMEIADVFSIKQEGNEDNLNVNTITDSASACAICKSDVLGLDLTEHVLRQHGLRFPEYETVAKTLKSPKPTEVSKTMEPHANYLSMTNECRFKCKYCTYEETCWRSMNRHISKTHNVKKIHDPFELLVHYKIYECKECKKPILHDRHIVYQHLRGVHKIRIGKIAKSNKSLKAADPRLAKNPELVINECKFRCKFCSQVFKSWKSAQDHHKNNHKKVGKILPIDSVIDPKFYECKLCGEKVLKDNRLIESHRRSHIRGSQGSNPKNMSKKRSRPKNRLIKNPHLVTNECKFRCKVCQAVFESWYSTLRHHRMNHKLSGKVLLPQDFVIEPKFHECNFCGKEVLKDNLLIKKHVSAGCEERKMNSKREVGAKPKNPHLVTNECKFQCKVCQTVFDSWFSTEEHHRRKHKSGGKKALPQDYVVEPKFNECKLCGKEVLKDNRLIRSHMRGGCMGKHINPKKVVSTKPSNKRLDKRLAKRLAKNPNLVINGCRFRCKLCQKVLDSWASTCTHHRMNHKSSGKIGLPQDSVIEPKFHECKSCGKEVLKDNSLIYYHTKYGCKKKAPKVTGVLKTLNISGMIENECKFQCKYCHRDFESWISIVTHHNANHEPLGSASPPHDAVIKSNWHLCCICGKGVLKDNMLVYNHIKFSHNLNTISYKRWLKLNKCNSDETEAHNYMVNSKKPLVRYSSCVGYNLDHNQTKSMSGTQPFEIAEINEDKATENGESFAEHQVINGCKFKCKQCDHENTSWQQMSRHSMQKHSKKVLDPFELVVKYKIFECLKCSKPMLQDRALWRNHMRWYHKTKIGQLPKNPNLVTNECKFRCKVCQIVFESWFSTTTHHRINHKSSGKIALPQDLVIEPKFHECNLCGKEVLKDNSLIKKHLSGSCKENNKKGTAAFENECKFKCKHCPKGFESWDSTLSHHNTEHNFMSMTPQPHESVIKQNIHMCFLCGMELLQDNRIICDHITSTHNLSTASYKKWLSVKDLIKNGTEDTTKENVQKDEESGHEANTQDIKSEVTSIADSQYLSDDEYASESAIEEVGKENHNEGTSKLLTICKLQCLPCRLIYNNPGHKMAHSRRKSENGSRKLEKSFHKCSLCDKNIVHKHSILSEHLSNKHNMNLSEYKDVLINENVMKQLGFEAEENHEPIVKKDTCQDDTFSVQEAYYLPLVDQRILTQSDSDEGIISDEDTNNQRRSGASRLSPQKGTSIIDDAQAQNFEPSNVESDDKSHGQKPPTITEVITLEDSEDEPDQTNVETLPNEKDESNVRVIKVETNCETDLENDSYYQLGQRIVNHLRGAKLSKGAMIAIESELLATIARHIP